MTHWAIADRRRLARRCSVTAGTGQASSITFLVITLHRPRNLTQQPASQQRRKLKLFSASRSKTVPCSHAVRVVGSLGATAVSLHCVAFVNSLTHGFRRCRVGLARQQWLLYHSLAPRSKSVNTKIAASALAAVARVKYSHLPADDRWRCVLRYHLTSWIIDNWTLVTAI